MTNSENIYAKYEELESELKAKKAHIAELEAMVEKMKCCDNCAPYNAEECYTAEKAAEVLGIKTITLQTNIGYKKFKIWHGQYSKKKIDEIALKKVGKYNNLKDNK